MQNNLLLEVENLSTHFFTPDGIVKAVQDVSFTIEKGKTYSLVGESGCGKSTTALSIMRLLPEPPGKIVSGRILLDGQDLTKLSEKRMREIRGSKIAMIFQEPQTCLNPVYTVGNQIAEVIKLHQKKSARQAWVEAIDALKRVGIAEPVQTAKMYPHQLSGGMRQRVLIAMAISCQPQLLIADEPTSALDVTIQAQILDLLDDLQSRTGMSIMLITHDLGIAAQRADYLAVMYASRIVEMAASQQAYSAEACLRRSSSFAVPTSLRNCEGWKLCYGEWTATRRQAAAKAGLFAEPLHPYTQALLKSLPHLGMSTKRMPTIPGAVPEPLHFPSGCKFHPRCRIGCIDMQCQTVEPSLLEVRPGRSVACWHAPSYEKR